MQNLYLFLFWQKNCLLPFILQNIWAAFYLTKYMGYRPDCLLALGYRWVMPWCSSDVQDVLMFHWCTGFPDVPVMHRMPWCSSDVSFCWNQSIFILPWLAGFLLTIFCLTFVWPLRVWWIFLIELYWPLRYGGQLPWKHAQNCVLFWAFPLEFLNQAKLLYFWLPVCLAVGIIFGRHQRNFCPRG